MSGNKVNLIFDDTDVISQIKENKKIPLMRVYDDDIEFTEEYLDSLILLAKAHGYKGITIAAYRAMRENKSALENFLMKLKKRMMEYDLLLFCELDGNQDTKNSDICDGYVIMYEKSPLREIPTFRDGEAKMLTEYAETGESSKAYIEIPSFAYMGDEVITKDEAENIAYTSGKEILCDEDTGICHFEFNKYRGGKREQVNVRYESLENIKAKLALAGELGYMGICFDIMRIPTEYLMLFETMFSRPSFYPDM